MPLLLLALLTGCLTLTPADSPPALTETNQSSLKVLNAQEQAEQAALATLLQTVKAPKSTKENYKIGPSDLLDIKVFREDELNRSLRVNQEGEVSFPFIGTIPVGGKSVIEAEKAIAVGLADFIKNPQVTIFVKEYSAKQVYVLGEVKNPGAIPLPTESGLTVLEAISLAGGFTPVAAQDRTRIIRSLPDGRTENLVIAVSLITRGGEKAKDLPLIPSDVVFVPQSLF